MTNQTETVLNSFKTAFAPMTDALNSLQTAQVPDAARDFVKRAAETARDRAAETRAQAEKVTAVIETAAAETVSESVKINRNIHQALFDDAEAFFNGLDKLASAKSLPEAVQIQSDFLRAQGELAMTRTKSVADYFGKLLADGAKNAQAQFASASETVNKAA